MTKYKFIMDNYDVVRHFEAPNHEKAREFLQCGGPRGAGKLYAKTNGGNWAFIGKRLATNEWTLITVDLENDDE